MNELKPIVGLTAIQQPNIGFSPDMAYPQYHHEFDGATITTKTWEELQHHVLELAINQHHMEYGPIKHWNEILLGIVPFNMKIVSSQ